MVAPTRNTSASSTAGSSVSCCALLKRWISSRKKIVRSPLVSRRCWARSSTARTSARPALTADASSKAAREFTASSRASVVLPVPGGPYRIIECGRPSSIAVRSAEPRAEQVLLADELAERRRSHARRERQVAGLGAGPAAGRVL